MIEIKESHLKQIKGIKPEQIGIIKDLFSYYDELTNTSAQELVETIEGFDLASANALINFAKMKSRVATSEKAETSPPVPNVPIPVATPVESKLIGTNVATKKRGLRDQSMVKQLGLNVAAQYYSKCSNCNYDLSSYAEEEEISLDDIDICPSCALEFVLEEQLNCYGCLKKLPSSGKCVTCGSSCNDSEEDKLKIILQLENGKSLQMAKLEKRNIELTPKILATARQEKWIEKRERLNFTGGVNPSSNLGYNFRDDRK